MKTQVDLTCQGTVAVIEKASGDRIELSVVNRFGRVANVTLDHDELRILAATLTIFADRI